MIDLKFSNKVLLLLFFTVLLTSLWPKNIYVMVLFASATYILLPFRDWDQVCSFLMLFSLSYAIMVIMHGDIGSGFTLISYIIAPLAFYRFGRWLMYMFRDDILRQKLFLAIILSYSLVLFILIVKDTSIVGVVNISRVMLEDAGNDSSLAATLYGLMASIGIGCVSCLFAKEQKMSLRLFFIFLAFFSLFTVIHLVNRTGIVVFFSCMVLSMFVVTRLKVFKMIPMLVIFFIIGLFLINLGIINDDVLIAYQNREMDSYANVSELGGRLGIWSDAILKLATNPFGWPRVRYAHNLWLDIARVGGWLPFFFFLLATITWVKTCFRLAKRHTTFNLLLLSINFAMLLASFVEPVMDASMSFFSLMMMIWGCTTYVSQEKLKTIE